MADLRQALQVEVWGMDHSTQNPLWEDTAGAPQASSGNAAVLSPLESAIQAMAEAMGGSSLLQHGTQSRAVSPAGSVGTAPATGTTAPDTDAATEPHATPADLLRRQHASQKSSDSPLCWTLEPTVMRNR